jgi:hypothetical protein
MATKEREILDTATQALRRTTGLDARVRYSNREGAVVEVVANRRKFHFGPEVKTVDRFAVPALLKARSKAKDEQLLLVAPYVTREVAERCRELRLPFIDTAGNAYLEGPGLLAYVVGQPKPAEVYKEHFRALNPAGLQVVFALLCQPTLAQTNYREIAENATVALGAVGPAIKDLEARGYLRYRKQTNPRILNPERLLEEWVTHYPVTLRPKLNARRFQAQPECLRQIDLAGLHALWSGEVAADKLTRYLKPGHYTIYTREPIAKLVKAGRMRADPAGNVEILDRFWNLGPAPDTPDVVPAILVYADLLATNDPRNVETAQMIHEQRIAPTFRKPD